jgi:hypothetical protein
MGTLIFSYSFYATLKSVTLHSGQATMLPNNWHEKQLQHSTYSSHGTSKLIYPLIQEKPSETKALIYWRINFPEKGKPGLIF